MCGIGGIVHFDGSPVDDERLAAMSHQLHHRGPDEGGSWRDASGSVAYVHRRLSIIDLGGSHQPMVSAGSRLTIAFNGEVLNYRQLRESLDYPYVTSGDTETILAAHLRHDRRAPGMLAGQFAYALHDAEDGSVSLVRDRLGILPLFYHRQGSTLVFASEIPALVAGIGHVPELDADTLPEYLGARYVAAPATLLRGVRKVRPGTVLTFSRSGDVTESGYWSPGEQTTSDLGEEEAIEQLDLLLDRALERSLVADVPVGAYLSGGVDSSLVVAKARKAGAGDIRTYCAAFGDARFDETVHAEAVSRHVGTTHETVLVRPTAFLESWADLSFRRGAPLAEPADVALYELALRARQDVKVVLSGEGSDELFAGYPKARFATATSRVGVLPSPLRGPLLRTAAKAVPASSRRAAVALRALSEDSVEDRIAAWFATFSRTEIGELGLTATSAPVPEGRTPLRRMLQHDLRGWLPDNLLERGDRMSMAASLELRPPFLDVDVVDFSLGLPDRLLVRKGVTKWLVKELARRYVPASVIDRPKVGFRVPLDAWFRGDLRSFARDTLTAEGGVTATHLRASSVRALLDDHERGRRDNAVKLWTLASLEVWHSQLGRALVAPDHGPPRSDPCAGDR